MTELATRVTQHVLHVEHMSLPRTLVEFVLLDLYVCISMYVLFSFFIWPLYCMSVFDLRFLITLCYLFVFLFLFLLLFVHFLKCAWLFFSALESFLCHPISVSELCSIQFLLATHPI